MSKIPPLFRFSIAPAIFILLSMSLKLNAQQSVLTFMDGAGVKLICWHPENDELTQRVEVYASPGRCGNGNYEIQWGDNSSTVVVGPGMYSHVYNLSPYKANVAAGTFTYNLIMVATNDECFYDITPAARFVINKAPVPVVTVTAACENVESTFTNASHGRNRTGLEWRWDFSNGETIPGTANPLKKKFDDPSLEYTVTLSVRASTCGSSEFVSSQPVSFKLKRLPTTIAEVTGIEGSKLCFTDESDSTIVLDASASSDANRFNWRITGGAYKVEELVKPDSSVMRIKMLESGTYTVNITARNECGAAEGEGANFSTTFESMPLPDINLIPQPDGCEELDYSLVNSKEGASYTLYKEWVPQALRPDEVVKLLVSDQPYVVEGYIENACGVKTDADTFYVHPKAPVEIVSLPRDTTVCVGSNSLELLASRDGGEWSQESVQVIAGKPMFYPNAEGDFEVNYQVGTGLCLTSDTRRVKVINYLAQASIGLDETDFRCSPARVIFSNRSEGHDRGYSVWSFQEGGEEYQTESDTISHIFHVDNSEKTFLVKLQVRNACGLSEATRPVKVLPSTITPLFNFPAGIFCPNVPIKFEDASVPAPTSWAWDFGDGDRSNLEQVEHRFSQPGVYAVTLEAGNQCATGRITHEVTIQVPPQPDFSVDTDATCEGQEVIFTNQSDTRYRFLWDFGDGSPSDSSSFNPAHIYTSEGNYPVKLTIFDGSKECQSAVEKNITISPVLQPSFSIEVPEEACEPALVKFVNHTEGGDVWRWEFSDGSTTRTSQVKEPLIPFTKGQYTFRLVASRGGACPTEATESAYFDLVNCAVEIPEAFTPNNDYHGDRYTLFGEGIDRIIFLRIRNRWSEVVFEMKDVPAGSQRPGESWDGTKDGKELPADMYVFEAKVRYRDQTESSVIKGNFYLIR